jgi:nucleotide-binding universal stress UspA family protein
MLRILVPIAGSELSEHAVPVAGGLARGLQAEIVLLTAGPFPKAAELAVVERIGRHQVLARARTLIAGIRVHERVSSDDDPAQGIHKAIADECPNLVVMSTHGRHGWAELLQGNVAEEVVRSGGVPVTLVSPHGTG